MKVSNLRKHSKDVTLEGNQDLIFHISLLAQSMALKLSWTQEKRKKEKKRNKKSISF